MAVNNVLDKALEAMGLPNIAYFDNSDGEGGRLTESRASVVAVRRGGEGYYPMTSPFQAKELNDANGVTEEQLEAMKRGVTEGWQRLVDERGVECKVEIVEPAPWVALAA